MVAERESGRKTGKTVMFGRWRRRPAMVKD
jgi:hypothetical protein